MKLPFTKMHGAGNDFVVLDATRHRLDLSEAQYRFVADRRFGIGADQILIVEPGDAARGTDFTYRIINADGGEVEQCGNGARCFARFVHDAGLTDKPRIRVQTLKAIIEPELQADGRVSAAKAMGNAPRRIENSAVRAVMQWRFEPLPAVREVDVEIAFNAAE